MAAHPYKHQREKATSLAKVLQSTIKNTKIRRCNLSEVSALFKHAAVLDQMMGRHWPDEPRYTMCFAAIARVT